jgi:hypothetical protein
MREADTGRRSGEDEDEGSDAGKKKPMSEIG